MTEREWWYKATQYAVMEYGVTLDDLGYESGDWVGESPEGYVERLAEKYGLTRHSDLC